MKKIKIALFALPLVGVLGLTLPVLGKSSSTKMALADDYGSVGNWYWSGINCTVEEFRNKGCAGDKANSAGFLTEITPNVGAKNVRLTFNQTVKGSVSGSNGEQMFGFSQHKDGGNVIATADMIVITLKNAKDLTKSISVVNRLHSDAWNAVGIAFTDQIELHADGYAYIKGTNQSVMGQQSAGTYNQVGKIFNSTSKTEAPLFGADNFYVNILADGTIQHNQWNVYGNILNADFLANSRANLSEDNPYYERYTTDWAQSVLTAMADDYNILQVTYYNIHTSDTLAFRMKNVGNEWLDLGKSKLPSMTYPFSMPKQDSNFDEPTLYTGKSYTIGDVIESHNRLAYSEGYTTEISGWNDISTHNDSTWIAANNLSKPFTSSTPGNKGVSLYTRANLNGQSWSNKYVYQDIPFEFLDGSPVVDVKENLPALEYGVEYDLSSFFEVSSPIESALTCTYTVDGVENTTGKITGDDLNHTVVLTAKDSANQTGSATALLKSDKTVVTEFVDTYLYMSSTTEGQCNTYYGPAKAAFNALTAVQRELFATDATFADAYLRLSAWAVAHGEEINAGYTISANKTKTFASNSSTFIVVILASVSALTFVGLFLNLKKKKEN